MRNKDLQDMITEAGIALDKISAMDNMILQGFFSYDNINGNKALIVHDYEIYKVCMSIMDDCICDLKSLFLKLDQYVKTLQDSEDNQE